MKKIISLFLSFTICFSLLCELDGIALAATTSYTYGDYTYTIISSYKKTAKITNYSGKDAEVNIPEAMDDKYTVVEIAPNTFKSTLIKKINIPQYVLSIDPLAFECDFLNTITVAEDNKSFASSDGVLYTKDMKTLVRFPVAYENETFSIPYGVEKIGNYAFRGPVSSSNAPSDLKLGFPESITEICYGAFYGAYISELKLPESLLTIGDRAFLDAKTKHLYIGANVENMGKDLFCTCSGTTYSPLKTIEVSEENEIFSSKDNVLFGNFGRDLIFYPRTKKNENYIVPDNVKTIKGCAFSFLSMDCIDLNNVEKLEEYAFFNVSIKKFILSEELNNFYATQNNTKFEIVSLNPECKISFNIYSWDTYDVKIYGYIGSTAESFVNEKYSDKLKLTFVSIDGEETENYHLPMPISFGTYPQKRVVSEALSAKLNTLDLQWESYDYYSGTGKMHSQEKSDYMQYTDVVYNGNKYRGVKFSQYRPVRSYLQSTENYSYQDDNGYLINNIYWFRYEPIEWQVLDKSTGLVVSSVALDAQGFCDDTFVNSNNYSESTIRFLLNNEFLNSAFTEEERELINLSSLEDFDIFDKVFLLSYNDLLKTQYGFTADVNATEKRYCEGSDYAQCQGLMVKTNTNVNNYYENNANWLLRTAGTSNDLICNVTVDGKLAQNHNIYNCDGIRPAMHLSTICDNEEAVVCNHNTTKLVGYRAPSCTKSGYSGDLICVSCTQTVEAGATIPALNHEYVLNTLTKATCTEFGEAGYACSVCGDKVVEQIEMKEHTAVVDCEVLPTYTTTGLTQGSHCGVCGFVIIPQTIIPVIECSHSSRKTVVLKKATMTVDGSSRTACVDCGRVISTSSNKSIKSIALSKTSLTYTGKELKKPTVIVKDSGGNKISKDNFTVTYISRSTGKRISSIKSIGQYKVIVTFKGKYSGTKYLYFTVKPKANAVKSLVTSKGSVTVKWSKDASVTGYQLIIAENSDFTKNKKTVNISKNSKSVYCFRKLKKGKKYYVKIRPYKNVKVDGKAAVIYGSYSKAKSIKCK